MARKSRITPAERRALRLAVWGGGPRAEGYLDGYDVRPPLVLADPAAQPAYDSGYAFGQLVRRGQIAKEEATQ